MKTMERMGRTVGVLMVLHLAVGLVVPFVLLDRVRGAAAFLESAAASPDLVRAAVFLLFVGSAMAIGISWGMPLRHDWPCRWLRRTWLWRYG